MKTKIFLILLCFFGLVIQTRAQGDLLITPTRVVFEGNKQKEELNIVNTGKDTAVYSISFVQFNMKEDGSFTAIEKPDSGQMFADPYLRIFPRKVTLAPREPQVVVLQFRRKADMADGEYRSHLYFRAEKKNEALGMENNATDTTRFQIRLTPIYGISIPIIIRTGAVDVKSTLTDLKFEKHDNTDFLQLCINRTGNISVYGDILVQYIPTEGKPVDVGAMKGVGVYTNINKRNIAVKLNFKGLIFKNGKLKVQYVCNNDNKRFVYAEEEVEIR